MSTVKPPKTPQIMTDDSNCINLFAIDTVNIALSTTVCHMDSCFILTGVLSSPLKKQGNILILLILFILFPLKGILTIMLLRNAFSNIRKKRRPTGTAINPWLSSITIFLLTLTVITILSDLIHTITVFLLTKRRRCLCLFDFLLSTLLTSVQYEQ